MTASFPPISLYALAYIAWVPLLFAIRSSSFVSAIFLGCITGLVHETILLSWIIPTLTTHAQFSVLYAFVLTIVMSAILSASFAICAGLTHLFSKKPHHLYCLPFFWVGLEWLKSHGQLAFPWELIGYSQYKCTTFIQISDIFGIYGVSAVILLVNVSIFIVLLAFFQKQWKGQTISNQLLVISIALLICIPTLIFIYGSKQIAHMDAYLPHVLHKTVMIVQPAIPQGEKWDGDNRIPITEKMVQLTATGKHNKTVDLVVWPETALPYPFHSKHRLRQFVLQAIQQMNIGLVVGTPTFINSNNQTTNHNSAYVIDRQGNIQSRYDKVRLVPFSEVLPFPFLQGLWMHCGAPDNKFSPGIFGQIHSLNDFNLGIQICFEIIFPQYARILSDKGANLLVNISNDAWFGQTASPYQHFSMAVFRAVENKRALIRCANTGISGIIDPCGRILSQSQLFETTTVVHRVPLVQTKQT
ncbi:MAG: apolipoprotein N-acyltransferase, partial [Candidatus Magnetomorum sp.]|nr:apolipoprotein N-acyltransferase [Candidatus Magnetomorum sp.]